MEEVRAVVLVEGRSDQHALEAVAVLQGRDLAGEGVLVVAMGGAGGISRFLREWGPAGRDVTVAGLCDAGEVAAFRRGLTGAGLASNPAREEMAAMGFHVCEADLEDELIRALGVPAVEGVLQARGELRAWRTFQRQPAQRQRSTEQQLRRFLGTRSGRKIACAGQLAAALDPGRLPWPLEAVLDAVTPPSRARQTQVR